MFETVSKEIHKTFVPGNRSGLHSFSDKVNLYLGVHMNKQNMHFWGQAQLHKHQYHPVSIEIVTVWFALGWKWHYQAVLVQGW